MCVGVVHLNPRPYTSNPGACRCQRRQQLHQLVARVAALAPPWPLPGKGLPLQLPQAPVGTMPQMQQRLHSTWARAHQQLRQGLCQAAAASPGLETLQLAWMQVRTKPQGLSLATAARLQVGPPCVHSFHVCQSWLPHCSSDPGWLCLCWE